MNADDFYKEIKALTPQVEDFKDYSLDFAELYLKEKKIEPLQEPLAFMPEHPVLDLIGRYDVSSLVIQIYGFFQPDDVGESDNYIYFGNREAFLVAIEKKSGRIAEIDYNEEYVVCYLAQDESHFLDFLVALERLNQKRMFKIISNEERDKQLKSLIPLMGGDEYAQVLEDL